MPEIDPGGATSARQFLLYSTAGCHLCELAAELLQKAATRTPLAWEVVDIAENEALVETYGVQIPVVRSCATGAELGWPFDLSRLLAWLAEHG